MLVTRALKIAAATLVAASVSGCGSGYFGTEKDSAPLEGRRIPVLALGGNVTPDPQISNLRVTLPTPDRNADWPQPGGIPSHVMHHLAASGKLERAWRVDIGVGSGSETQLMAQPVTDGTRVYTMDVEAEVRAYDLRSGDRVWSADLEPDEDDDGILGGGIAVSDGRIFVTTGFAFVIALDANTGKEIWRQRLSGPMRAGPTIYRGRVFAITVANELFALSADDGRQLWTHTGIVEAAGLLGGAAPAAGEGVVVAPYSSGEVVALRVENGRVLWSDALAAIQRTDPVSSLAHIRGAPVIDRDRVIVVAHSGRMVAINLRSGSRLWEQGIGGTHAPWVAGEFVFVLSSNNEVVCLSRREGRVRWVQTLPRFEDEEDKEDPIIWAGPVLVGDRLLVTSSLGDIWTLSPYTGEIVERKEAPGPVLIPPAVAQETVFLLTEDADLVALR